MLTNKTVLHFNSSRSRPTSVHCDERALAGAQTCGALSGGDFVVISLGASRFLCAALPPRQRQKHASHSAGIVAHVTEGPCFGLKHAFEFHSVV
jgi:hypothetical protein